MTGFTRLLHYACGFALLLAVTTRVTSSQEIEPADVISFFEANRQEMPISTGADMLRLAFSEGREKLCSDFLEGKSPQDLIALVSYCSHFGDLGLIRLIAQTVTSDAIRIKIVESAVASLANAQHFDKAIEAMEILEGHTWNRGRSVDTVAAYAYFFRNDKMFEKCIGFRPPSYQSALTIDGLQARRLRIEATSLERQRLGISNNWDELLTAYRLGTSPVAEDLKAVYESLCQVPL